jgi:hypothetical protein
MPAAMRRGRSLKVELAGVLFAVDALRPGPAPLPASLLEKLAQYDTPTICNAMEVVAPERRLIGYTTKPLVCPFPDLPPMVRSTFSSGPGTVAAQFREET